MKRRCQNPRSPDFERYGGRGIRVCDEWRDFAAFRSWAIAAGYGDDLSIERVVNDGDYTPANCRWVPLEVQARNRRSSRPVTAWGETRTLAEWIRDPRRVVSQNTVRARLDQGWALEDAMTVAAKNHKKASFHVTVE